MTGTFSYSHAPAFFGPTQAAFFQLASFAVYVLISFLIILIQSIRVYWLKK